MSSRTAKSASTSGSPHRWRENTWIRRSLIARTTWDRQVEPMTTSEHLVNTAIAEQARGWFVANEEGPLGAQETAAFLSWLRASPVHVRAFLRVSRIARDLKAAAEDPNFALETLLEEARADTVDQVVTLEPATDRRGHPVGRRRNIRSTWVL